MPSAIICRGCRRMSRALGSHNTAMNVEANCTPNCASQLLAVGQQQDLLCHSAISHLGYRGFGSRSCLGLLLEVDRIGGFAHCAPCSLSRPLTWQAKARGATAALAHTADNINSRWRLPWADFAPPQARNSTQLIQPHSLVAEPEQGEG